MFPASELRVFSTRCVLFAAMLLLPCCTNRPATQLLMCGSSCCNVSEALLERTSSTSAVYKCTSRCQPAWLSHTGTCSFWSNIQQLH